MNTPTNYWIGPITIITPYEIRPDQYINIDNAYIKMIQSAKPASEFIREYDWSGYYCFPALINPHDHLQGTYWPRVGQNRPYLTFKPWITDLINSDTVAERKKIDNLEIYLLGAYKNLLAGCTTVQDHYPHEALPNWPQGGNNAYLSKLPIRVSPEYTLAHEVHSEENQWGMGPETEHKWAVERNWPFITHLEEGFTEECMRGVDYLKEARALSDHTVLIHCLGLSNKDIEDIAEAGTHIVTCPFSNFFMFEAIARLKEIRRAGINLSLGTDSPASGSMHILEEMKFLKNIYYDTYGEAFPDKDIVEMVTCNPAKALRVDDTLGQIRPGFLADLLFIEKHGVDDPYACLVQAEHKHISLLLKKGKPILGDSTFFAWFKEQGNFFSEIRLGKIRKYILGDVKDLLRNIYKKIGFVKKFPFLPIH